MMLTYPLASKLFESFSILRWNDRLRPIEFVEIDHHALKSIVTFFLGKSLENDGVFIDWVKIVNGNVFDLMRKISISDIHADVEKILKNDTESSGALNEMIENDWAKEPIQLSQAIKEDFKEYVSNTDLNNASSKVLVFAHKYVSKREFHIIREFCGVDFDTTSIADRIAVSLSRAVKSQHLSESRMAKELAEFDSSNRLYTLLCLIERLRYQTRWSQTLRTPTTSVLGHSMYTAVLAYFMSVEAGLHEDRIVNNFFAALFHDLPEALTRDIIYPVKSFASSIENKIAEIERKQSEERILSCIPEKWKWDMRFIMGQLLIVDEHGRFPDNCEQTPGQYLVTGDVEFLKEHGEFSNRILYRKNARISRFEIISWEEKKKRGVGYYEQMASFCERENTMTESLQGIDGKMIKICDSLSAFMEAHMSIQHGLSSSHLNEGRLNTKKRCEGEQIYNLHMDDFFKDIKIEEAK